MALELETEIMREIGLGNHYTWSNGSGSCRGIREAAVEKLSGVLARRAAAGEPVRPPQRKLIALARRAAAADESIYELTITWRVCSDVIRAHLAPRGSRQNEDASVLAYWTKKLPSTKPGAYLPTERAQSALLAKYGLDMHGR